MFRNLFLLIFLLGSVTVPVVAMENTQELSKNEVVDVQHLSRFSSKSLCPRVVSFDRMHAAAELLQQRFNFGQSFHASRLISDFGKGGFRRPTFFQRQAELNSKNFDGLSLLDSFVARLYERNVWLFDPKPEQLNNLYTQSAVGRQLGEKINNILDRYLERFPPQNADFVQTLTCEPGKVLDFIGDIHGDFVATQFHIKSSCQLDASQVKIFLGDYVDRGPFGLESLLSLLEFKLKNPNSVILLRGNHENITENENELNGFVAEVLDKMGEDGNIILKKIELAYTTLPSRLVIESGSSKKKGYSILAVHGGIPAFCTFDTTNSTYLLDDETSFVGSTGNSFSQISPHQALAIRWGDVCSDQYQKDHIDSNFVHNGVHPSGRFAVGEPIVPVVINGSTMYHRLQEKSCALLVRGHNHFDSPVKLLPNFSVPKNLTEENPNNLGWVSWEKSGVKFEQVGPHAYAVALNSIVPVFTLSSASTVAGLGLKNRIGFVRVALTEEQKNLRPIIFDKPLTIDKLSILADQKRLAYIKVGDECEGLIRQR